MRRTKKSYTVSLSTEATITLTIRAEDADEANEIARERARSLLNHMQARYKSVLFGDLEDYVPARD